MGRKGSPSAHQPRITMFASQPRTPGSSIEFPRTYTISKKRERVTLSSSPSVPVNEINVALFFIWKETGYRLPASCLDRVLVVPLLLSLILSHALVPCSFISSIPSFPPSKHPYRPVLHSLISFPSLFPFHSDNQHARFIRENSHLSAGRPRRKPFCTPTVL